MTHALELLAQKVTAHTLLQDTAKNINEMALDIARKA